MADPIPTNAGVLDQQRNVFANHWFTYFSQLETSVLQGDFSGIETPDPAVSLTNDEIRDLLIQILNAAKNEG